MKKVKKLVALMLFCAMGYAGYTVQEKMTASEAGNFMQANVEALTQGESGGGSGWVYCRCHNDQHCYVGNAISVRPSCVRIYGSSDCDSYKGNCPPAGV